MKIVDRIIDALFTGAHPVWTGKAAAVQTPRKPEYGRPVERWPDPARPTPTMPNGSIEWGDDAELNLAELHLTTALASITGFVQVDDDALMVAERKAADAVYAIRRIRSNRKKAQA